MANLINAIKSRNTDIALSLILYNDFDYTDNNGDTVLICACEYNMKIVAIALLATGKSKPDHINDFGDTSLRNGIA
jgi:ankyrin repeat protein